jgi:hypothetical protein
MLRRREHGTPDRKVLPFKPERPSVQLPAGINGSAAYIWIFS